MYQVILPKFHSFYNYDSINFWLNWYGKLAKIKHIAYCIMIQAIQLIIFSHPGIPSATPTWSTGLSTVGCTRWPTSASSHTRRRCRSTRTTRRSPTSSSWVGRAGRRCTWRRCTTPWRAWPPSGSATSPPRLTTKRSSPSAWWSWQVWKRESGSRFYRTFFFVNK